MNKLILLLLLVLGVSQAQSPSTQIDYNRQIRNTPTSYTAIPGTNTLASAVTNTPAGGTLIIPIGTYTMSTGVTIAKTLTIVCQPGAVLLNSTINMIMLTFTGTHQSIIGCTLDGQSISTQPIIGTSASTYFTVTESTFQNMGNNPSGYTSLLFNGSWGTFTNNRFLNIGSTNQCSGDCPGIGGLDAHYVTVSGNQFSDIWGNAVHFFSSNITVTPGDFIRVTDNTTHNIGRNCIEFGPFVYQKIDVIGNSCDTWTGIGFGISIGFVPSSGVVANVSGNTMYQPDSAISLAGAGTYGLEMLCDYCISQGNYIYGSFTDGILVGGHDQKVIHNYLWKNQTGIAENDSSYFPINTTIQDNTVIEARDVGISSGGNGGGGIKILHNTVIRTPGSWTSDSGRTFIAIVAGNYLPGAFGVAPILISGNELTIEISGFSLAAWYGFAFESSSSSLNVGSMIRDNVIWNKNTTAFGIGYRDFGNSALGGVSETGNRYVNISSIGNPSDAGLGAISISYYADNVSSIGNGSGLPPTDYTIGNNAVVRTYQLTGQSGTIGGTNAIFIGLKGMYLVLANTHIVTTNNTGTLTATLTIPRNGTQAFGPNIASGVDGSSLGQLVYLNVNDQISYTTTASGLTATNYTVSVNATLVTALQ